jgi:hypothetical protein
MNLFIIKLQVITEASKRKITMNCPKPSLAKKAYHAPLVFAVVVANKNIKISLKK